MGAWTINEGCVMTASVFSLLWEGEVADSGKIFIWNPRTRSDMTLHWMEFGTICAMDGLVLGWVAV